MVIDLDRPPPSRTATPSPLRPRVLALAVAGLLAFLLGASQPPGAEPAPMPVAARTGARTVAWLLTGDALYSVHTRPQDSMLTVVARTLSGGRERWSRQIDGQGFSPELHELGPNLALSLGGVWMSLLDAATGAEVWNDHAYPGAILAGDLIVLWKDDVRLGALDPRTARPVWWQTARTPPIAAVTTARHLQVLHGDGTAVLHDRRTGARVAETRGIPIGDGFDDRPRLSVAGDLAFVLGRGNVTALRVPSLDRLWTTRMNHPTAVNRCGTRLCVTGSAGLTALDQQNGKVVWASPVWVSWHNGLAASRSGQVARLDPETGTVTGREMSGWLSGDLFLRKSGEEHYVIDTVTGRIRGWQVAPGGWLRCTSTLTHLACPAGGDTVTAWRLS